MHQQDTSSNSSNSSDGSKSPSSLVTTTTEGLEANLSPISCIACRRAHKRCDRKFPSCSKCVQRGIECAYNEPKKRGKASETYRQKKRIKQDGTELKQIVHYYFSYIAGGYPIISKAKFEYFIDEYLTQIENSDEFTMEKNQYIENENELNAIYTFFLAIKSIYFQLNANLPRAIETMTMCEEYLGKLLTKSMHFYIYATCQMVAIFYSGAGDLAKVRFYDTMVNYYLNGNEKTVFDKYEENMRRRMTCLSKSSTDFLDEYSGFFKKMPEFFENSVARKLKDLLLPGTLEYLQLAPKTLEGYTFFQKVTEFTFRVMGQYHNDIVKEMKDCHTNDFFKFEQVFRTIMYFGFHLYYLNALPYITPQLEEVALKITIASESEYFRYAIPDALISIKGAAQVHLNICLEIESGKRKNNSILQTSDGKVLTLDYYSLLEKDINALTSLQKKYPNRVAEVCEELLNNMKSVLQSNNDSLIRLSKQLVEDNDLEPIYDHCNSDCCSDQSNDLTRSDDNTCPSQQEEGTAKWSSLIHYLQAIDGELTHTLSSSHQNNNVNTDLSQQTNDGELDLDQFII